MRVVGIFELGKSWSYIKLCRAVEPLVKGENFLLDSLERVKSFLEEFEIDSQTQDQVSDWIQKLSKNYRDKQKIKSEDASKLREEALRWLDSIRNDLFNRGVFQVFRALSLNQTALMNASEGKPSAFFEEQTWNALSEIEKNDFSNSAKCLLAGLPTPAVMVALRGAEATVKRFFEHKTGEKAKEKLWGSVIRELKKKSEALEIRESFLGYLDYIRDAKRNFAEHPNKIFDQREAELIFMEIVNLVQDTYAEMV